MIILVISSPFRSSFDNCATDMKGLKMLTKRQIEVLLILLSEVKSQDLASINGSRLYVKEWTSDCDGIDDEGCPKLIDGVISEDPIPPIEMNELEDIVQNLRNS